MSWMKTMRYLIGVTAVTACTALVVTSSATAAGVGLNRPNSPAAAVVGTGYGKGWVAVSGQRDGPIQGYLFYADPDTGTYDFATIWDPSDSYPVSYAWGYYGGCANMYGINNVYYFNRLVYPANPCTVPGAQYNNTTTQPTREQYLYCTNPAVNRHCTPRGAYDDNDSVPVTVQDACPAIANIGAQMFTGSATAHAIAHYYLPRYPNSTGVSTGLLRYVTKDGQWALVKFPTGSFINYPDMHWAFVPTVCGF